MIFILLGLFITFASIIYWLFFSSYSQFFGRFIYKVNCKENKIAITFDDGPNGEFTNNIVDFLNKHKIKATFFVVGKNALKYPEIIKNIHKSGHTIGNHSLSHNFINYITDPSFKKEISACQNIIHDITGEYPKLFRPPWLFRQRLLLNTVKKQNMRPISGEFCSFLEVFQPQSKLTAKNALKKVKPGTIIIFHDGFDAKGGDRRQTIEAAKEVISSLLKQKYQFVTVDELINTKPYI